MDYAFNETRHQIEMAEHDEDPTLPLWMEAHNRAREMALFWQAVRPTARNVEGPLGLVAAQIFETAFNDTLAAIDAAFG